MRDLLAEPGARMRRCWMPNPASGSVTGDGNAASVRSPRRGQSTSEGEESIVGNIGNCRVRLLIYRSGNAPAADRGGTRDPRAPGRRSPSAAAGWRGPNPTVVPRAIRRVEYLEAVRNLREQPIRDVAEYRDRRWWAGRP